MRSRRERRDIFVRRLAATLPASSGDEAFELLARALDGVEDEFSNAPFDPAAWTADGRMYPPPRDNAFDVADRPGATRYRSVGHNVWIDANGAIRIEDRKKRCVLNKPGADGRTFLPD